MFHLLDTYSAGISLLCSALFEAIAVSWFYGKLETGGEFQREVGAAKFDGAHQIKDT